MKMLNELSFNENEILFRMLKVSLTYHSNAIEGGTLSFGETKKLLENNITANGKKLSEQLEIKGFAKAFNVIIREAANQNKIIDNIFLKDIHSLLFTSALQECPEDVERPIGAYRTEDRIIKGVDVLLSHPKMISNDIDNLLFMFQNKMSIEDIAIFHRKFEKIHPFANGNGRVGRLIMTFQSIKNNIIPPLIKNDYRKEYIHAFQNKNDMIKFLKLAQKETMDLIKIS